MAILCYLDAFSGISGDMLVGALADAGADRELILKAVESLETGAVLSFERVKRCGIAATKFHVSVSGTHTHRHLSHILKMIEKGELPERAKQNASDVFRRLGEAEAAVHQVPIEKVHFHEVGAADSIADIVGACVAFESLGVDAIVSSPLNLGSGTVKTEHGLLPVPAPATAALVTGKPVYSRGPAVELTTPTGAAVAATLAHTFGALPPMKITRTGYGAGGHDFPEQPNVLRVILGEATGAVEATTVSVIEANIDDLSPQILAYAVDRLLDTGALDATLQSIEMKKGRPGVLLRVIAKPEDRERLAQLVFGETSTLGLRIYEAERRVQKRDWLNVETPHGTVRMKVAGEGNYAPEYEDCRRLADEHRRSAETDHGRSHLRVPEEFQMKYYLTTPIYYVNAAPHIGHAYTTIAADTIKRFKRMQGYDAVLTTGTDEHGQNIERAAKQIGQVAGKSLPTRIANEFREQWERLDLEIDRFMRTYRPQASQNGPGAVPALPRQRLHLQRLLHRPVLLPLTSSTSTTPSRATPAPTAAVPPRPSPRRTTSSNSPHSAKSCSSSTRTTRLHPARNAPQRSHLFRQAGLERPLHQPHDHQVGHPGARGRQSRLLRLVRRA